MKDSTFNLLRVSAGRTFFARVTVQPSVASDGLEVSVSGTAFEDAEGHDRHPDWAAAAERGIRYAVGHTSAPFTGGVRLVVTSILGTEVDTTPDAVAAAACFATWEALEVVGTHPPRLEGREFIFDL